MNFSYACLSRRRITVAIWYVTELHARAMRLPAVIYSTKYASETRLTIGVEGRECMRLFLLA